MHLHSYVDIISISIYVSRTFVTISLVEQRRTVDLAVTAPVGRDAVEQARELVVTAD